MVSLANRPGLMVKSNAMLSPRIAEGLPLNNFKSWKFSWMLSADTRTLLKHNLKGPVKLKMWNVEWDQLRDRPLYDFFHTSC